MTELKAEYQVSRVASPHEYKCTCGNVLGYLRNAGNWVVLLRTNGDINIGETRIYCPICGNHRHFKRFARAIPAFLDETRDKQREDIAVLLEEARTLASN